MAAAKVVIKKYANRRLYDTERSAYITLDNLAQMIRDGRDFEVVDAKSGEDITRQVLTQIIVEEEARGGTMLPVKFLRQLIGLYGGASQALVPSFLEDAMDAFSKNSQAVAGAFSPTAFQELARRNLTMFEEAASAFTGKRTRAGATRSPASRAAASSSSTPAGGDGGDELASLRDELAALQAKVEKFGR